MPSAAWASLCESNKKDREGRLEEIGAESPPLLLSLRPASATLTPFLLLHWKAWHIVRGLLDGS